MPGKYHVPVWAVVNPTPFTVPTVIRMPYAAAAAEIPKTTKTAMISINVKPFSFFNIFFSSIKNIDVINFYYD